MDGWGPAPCCDRRHALAYFAEQPRGERAMVFARQRMTGLRGEQLDDDPRPPWKTHQVGAAAHGAQDDPRIRGSLRQPGDAATGAQPFPARNRALREDAHRLSGVQRADSLLQCGHVTGSPLDRDLAGAVEHHPERPQAPEVRPGQEAQRAAHPHGRFGEREGVDGAVVVCDEQDAARRAQVLDTVHLQPDPGA